MYHVMYTSTSWYARYNNGEVSWGVSEEGKRAYPYMEMQVVVPSSEVIGIETKVTGDETTFISYDIRKGGNMNGS